MSRLVRNLLRPIYKRRALARDQAFQSRTPEVYLAACLIFRNEANNLDEWIQFHLGVGIEHFYLFNNNSTDHYEQVLDPYIKRKVVMLSHWADYRTRDKAYALAAEQCADHTRWLAIFDSDEFLFSVSNQKVSDSLRLLENVPAIQVLRYEYGANGHTQRPNGPIIDNYLKRSAAFRGVKSIINPRLVAEIGHHQCRSFGGRQALSTELRINHYWARSLEDLNAKNRNHRTNYDGEYQLQREAENNKVRDEAIFQRRG